ncbi:MAG: metal-dependent hydrolase [Candidatus Bathyarchaeia archaeon]
MVKIRWLGHAACEIEMNGKIVLIDPWLDGNPKAAVKASDIKKADIVCVTHDHMDHLGDAFQICKRTGATFVGTYELGTHARENGVKEVVGINVGGTADVKGIKVSMMQAIHTSGKGVAVGFIIKGEEKTIYHAGDTAVFGDMKLIGEIYHPDIAILPIGGYYTMGAEEAAEAVKLIQPKIVIPIHYGTFPVLASTAEEFIKNVKERAPKVKVIALNPGEAYQA